MEAQNPYFLIGRNAFLSGDWKVARKNYKTAVRFGSVSALHNLGVMLLHGQGCMVDYSRACRFFQESAFYGICESMNQLGYMYYYGKGCSQDFFAARSWFLSSEMHGSHPYAQYHLGIISALGQGVPQDWKEAAKWLTLSADQGYSPAIYNLGVLYFNGDGVKQNFDHALELYARAAVKGHAAGENNFAVMCAEGLGTLRRPVENIMAFWERAAAKNVSEAHYNLVNIHLTVDIPAIESKSVPEEHKNGLKPAHLETQAPAQRAARECTIHRPVVAQTELKRGILPAPNTKRATPQVVHWQRGPHQTREKTQSAPQGLKISTADTNPEAVLSSVVRPRASSKGNSRRASTETAQSKPTNSKETPQPGSQGILRLKSLPARASRPQLVPRQSSRRVEIARPVSFVEHIEKMSKSDTQDSSNASTIVPKGSTASFSSSGTHQTVSCMEIRPVSQRNHSLPTPDHSPVSKMRSITFTPKKRVPLARLASASMNSRMPPSPVI